MSNAGKTAQRRPKKVSPRTLAPSLILRPTPRQAGGGRYRHALVQKSYAMIAEGSKSFAAASRLFDPVTRERVWMLYAWCRRCDDIADGQEMGGELGNQSNIADRVKSIRILTRRALAGEPTADVAFDAFGQVASEVGLTMQHADDVIAGFELDAQDWRPRSEDDLARYCYHVAGAVGVMMAKVMGVQDDDEYTLDRACDLGLAFQLANIARDLDEDDRAGRCYLPMEWLAEEDIEPGQLMKPHHQWERADLASRLVLRMDRHAKAARLGTVRLPFRSRWAILAAANIYSEIGLEVRRRGPKAWDHRVVIPAWEKLRLITSAFFEAIRNNPLPPDEMPVWTRDAILLEVRMRGPIAEATMEPLPDGE
ncbi:phytoene/squalene synthase family protein [Pontixanthobacter aestiaquae]|uniref:Phytoene/squalene synthase family protein n=1 Tax=Pontixanthobacter aestiaquae TaxID=1509367 RepID=A0A844Z3X2_9SPHN|nr:phytoene/squalene synthase family protein [Pontixanthobacter aestiaquae]MDN3646386.1 phytoene/squalene synthase family protein [Pontixanthobacter aestiaquae]MXO82625.1 phytoene/squalene synthase family protein [Pontixanthobacter aestiaquae]